MKNKFQRSMYESERTTLANKQTELAQALGVLFSEFAKLLCIDKFMAWMVKELDKQYWK